MIHRRSRSNFGVLLLLSEMYRFGFDRIPPVTLATIGGQVALYLKLFNFPYARKISDACISGFWVWYRQDWKRLFLSPFFHADDFHLYFNMASYLVKGSSLEKRWGSMYFAYVIVIFSALTSIVYVGLSFIIEHIFEDSSYINQCAIGFSGVLFALKVITTHYLPSNTYTLLGFLYLPIPARYSCWAELLLIQVLSPNVSFIGHLAGIIVGYLYVLGPLKYIMDTFCIFGIPGYRHTNFSRTSRVYGSGTPGFNIHNYTGGMSEEEQLQSVLNQHRFTSSYSDSGTHQIPTAPPYPTSEPYPTPGYTPTAEELRSRRANRWL